tara:strand:+ start:729 stop:977 length:249 start_codon:yes stop_codon:yes gene_type:complete
MLAQVHLHDLILKVDEHELEMVQELVVHVLRFAITDDNDALIRIIKNMLKNGLSFDNIVNVVLQVVNAMIEQMTDDWETNHE